MESNNEPLNNIKKHNIPFIIIKLLLFASIILIILNFYKLFNSNCDEDPRGYWYMPTAEINEFNSKWEDYIGEQTGSKVIELLGLCNSNAEVYQDELIKVPIVTFVDETKTTIVIDYADYFYNSNPILDFEKQINQLSNEINKNAKYQITMTLGNSGIYDEITITYSPKAFTSKINK